MSKGPVDHTKKWVELWLAAVLLCNAPIGQPFGLVNRHIFRPTDRNSDSLGIQYKWLVQDSYRGWPIHVYCLYLLTSDRCEHSARCSIDTFIVFSESYTVYWYAGKCYAAVSGWSAVTLAAGQLAAVSWQLGSRDDSCSWRSLRSRAGTGRLQ